MKRMRTWFARKKLERARTLLETLARTPEEFRAAEELGSATGLGTAAYPLLAELDRLGAVERRWSGSDGRQRLVYRLTGDGRALAQAPHAVLADHLLER